MKERIVEQLQTLARIPPRFRGATFATFQENPDNTEALHVARSYFQNLAHGGDGFYLFGPPGVGKTHLAVAILNHAIEKQTELVMKDHPNPEDWPFLYGQQFDTCGLDQYMRQHSYGRTLRFINTQEYLARLKGHFGTPEHARAIADTVSADLLAIDDLGAETLSNWSVDEIFYIIFHRYNQCLPTIFTSNHTVDDLVERYCRKISSIEAERMISRLLGTCVGQEIRGADWRRLPRPARLSLQEVS